MIYLRLPQTFNFNLLGPADSIGGGGPTRGIGNSNAEILAADELTNT